MTSARFLDPSSVSWRVHSGPGALVGGIRSLMVQTLEPRAMTGVAQHSVMREDFWGRLQRTNDFLLTVIFGSKADAEASAAVVRSVHAKVTGFDFHTRRPYRADEPELLIWVHNATVESHLHTHRRHAGSLSSHEADRYIDEMRVLGELMGVSRDELPATEVELRAYFARREPELDASPDAKEAVRILLNPDLPTQLKALWNLPAVDAFASLPASYKRKLSLPWLAPVGLPVQIGTNLLLRSMRALLPQPPIVEQALRENADIGAA